jgi:hypothetical protein
MKFSRYIPNPSNWIFWMLHVQGPYVRTAFCITVNTSPTVMYFLHYLSTVHAQVSQQNQNSTSQGCFSSVLKTITSGPTVLGGNKQLDWPSCKSPIVLLRIHAFIRYAACVYLINNVFFHICSRCGQKVCISVCKWVVETVPLTWKKISVTTSGKDIWSYQFF